MFANLSFNTVSSLDIVPKVWYTVIVPNVFGRYYTLAKWLFKEDYFICKFCQAQNGDDIIGERLDELILLLSEAGFEPRSKAAIQNRAREFTYLLRGWDNPNTPRRVRYVYDALSNTIDEKTHQWIKHYVDEFYRPDSAFNQSAPWINDNKTDLTQFIDIEIPEQRETFHKVFHELLNRYYDKRLTGKKTRGQVKKEFREDLSCLYGISGYTFDALKREKYETVSRPTIFRLCFALELDYDDAKRLLESVGYDFRRNIKAEVVIEALLKCDSPRRFIVSEVDETLYKHTKTTLFSQ